MGRFANLSTPDLIRRMEQAGPDDNLDDETVEMDRRFGTDGWGWDRSVFGDRIELAQ